MAGCRCVGGVGRRWGSGGCLGWWGWHFGACSEPVRDVVLVAGELAQFVLEPYGWRHSAPAGFYVGFELRAVLRWVVEHIRA